MKTVILYGLSSVLSVLVDQGVFALLNMVLLASLGDGLRMLLSTFIARVISSLVNYWTNARLVFRQKSVSKKTFVRYVTLCATQMVMSYLLVLTFSHVFHTSGWGDSLVKVCVDTSLFFVNYFVQKLWVFGKP